MIYITGDTHGHQNRILMIEHNTMIGKGDYLIVCGDFGFLFKNDKAENMFLDDLKNRPYTICFIDGNHCNFPAIYEYPVEEWNCGKIHRIRNNVIHLMRGQIFTIDDKTFFTMGGAYSTDRATRIKNYSWWPEELPSDEEYEEAYNNLEKIKYEVDYIITHTMPGVMIKMIGHYPDAHEIKLNNFLDTVMQNVEYKHWYCGHWHEDKDLTSKFSMLLLEVKCIG